MKSYRRKFIKKALNDSATKRVESRDGILWTIDSDSQCRVKIQGSNELVTAHFPRNQKARPSWLRIGNAVRIAHRGGIRGYIEVIGQGRAIPAPTYGSAMPPQGTTGDGILTGMIVSQTNPVSNSVLISNGSYRINGTIYYYTGQGSGYIVMGDTPPMLMGQVPVAAMGVPSFVMDAAPSSGYFRYDAVVIGSDRVTDYIVGVPAASNPVKPGIPANHILLNYILRVGGDTGIPDERIGIDWTVPRATRSELTIDPPTFLWSSSSNTPEKDMVLKVYDQYGKDFPAPSSGWNSSLMKVVGTGNVYSRYTGYNENEVTQPLAGVSTYTFKYQRNQLISEIKPFFLATVDSVPPLYAVVEDMMLMDVNGDPIG